jgi:hypothetical protein
MQTEWIAAMTGLAEFLDHADHAMQVGLRHRLGRAEFLDVCATRKRLAGAGDHDGLDGGIGVGLLEVVGEALARGVAQAVDGRVAQRDHCDGAVNFVKGQPSCDASFLDGSFSFQLSRLAILEGPAWCRA